MFKNREKKIIIPITNRSIRPIKWQFSVEKDYDDIFVVTESTSGTVPAKSVSHITVTFKPQIGVSYSATACLNSGDVPISIFFSGSGIDPILEAEVNESNTNYGVVGTEAPEYRDIVIHNPTSLPMRIRPKSDNPDFNPVDEEIVLIAGERAVIRVLFRPTNEVKNQVGNISVYLLSDSALKEDERENEFHEKYGTPNGRPMSQRYQTDLVQSFKLEGRGGKFGFNVQGADILSLDELSLDELSLNEDTPTSPSIITSTITEKFENLEVTNLEATFIQIKFGKIQLHQKLRKSFELENSGETFLEFVVEFPSKEKLISDKGCMGFSVSPSTCKIAPKSKLRISVVVEVRLGHN